MTSIIINLQITIVTYALIGFILYKTKIIDDNGQNFLSKFVLDFVLPISVFVSFYKNISFDLLRNLSVILIMSIIFEVLIYIFVKLFKNKGFTDQQQSVANYAYLVSNGGLIGTPVIEGLYGPTGVVICNVFLIPTRIMAYAAGESIFNPSLEKSIKDICITIVTNKIIDAMILALIIVGVGLTIPSAVVSALSNIGKCMSPLSLILVGSMLAQKVDFNFNVIEKVLRISLIRLIIIPVIVFVVCSVLSLDRDTTMIMTLLLGMPSGSTAAIFAKKYKGDEAFGSLTVMVTTLLSVITLVGLVYLTENFI